MLHWRAEEESHLEDTEFSLVKNHIRNINTFEKRSKVMETKMARPKWGGFTTRDFVEMAGMVVVAGLWQWGWAQFIYGAQIIPAVKDLFGSFGFNVVSFLIILRIRKPGAATIVKLLSGVVELMLGSPIGLWVILADGIEGLGVDLAFWWFRGNINMGTVILGSLIAWALGWLPDGYRDAVPLTLPGLLGYYGPGFIGKIFTSVMVFWALIPIAKTGWGKLTASQATTPATGFVPD